MTRSKSSSNDTHDSERTDIPPQVPAVLTIDLCALRQNYRHIKDFAQGATCAAVVKADAYGIGAVQAVGALMAEGCDTFFIATLEEARILQKIVRDSTLYALDGLLPGTSALFAELGVRPVLNSLAEVEEWATFCNSRGKRLGAAIHVDTGMNRLGMGDVELERLTRIPALLEAFDLTLVMSHLACSDDAKTAKNESQREAFDDIRTKLPSAPASLANSGGVFLGPDYHFDMVRPGIALYGGRPRAAGDNPMAPVVVLKGRILQIRHAAGGETVGYGASRTLKRPTRIAIVAAGYADGYFCGLSSDDRHDGAFTYVGDHKALLLGRVSMDLIALDVTDINEKLTPRGAFVELLGGHIGIDDLAQMAGTIGYEVLVSLGQRYHRVYLGA